ncbi:MAG TPA: sulfatase [Acidobacteriota bacterium]|nr:sulfatase [Acidobacteriota bacterium]
MKYFQPFRTRIPALCLLLLALGLLPAPLKAQRRAVNDRPNLLVVTFDTTRADRLQPYGYEDARTPTIGRLAREGVLFTHCNAQSPQTLPSHSSIFTGQYTITHNVRSNGQKLEDDAITMAEILSVEGYQTGAVVATAALMGSFNLKQGFGTYNDDFEDPALTKAFKGFFRFFSRGKVNITTTRPANRVSRLGRNWLSKAAKRKRPFFLWLHFFDPHSPYVYYPDFDKPAQVREDGPENEYGELEENYINEIEFADYYLGKVIAHMEDLGVLDNTLIVFTADHGESLGEHDYQGHRQEVYEHIIQVPLIMRFPKSLPQGQRLDTPAMSIDIAPTVLRLLDVPYPDQAFPGTDLMSLDPDSPRERFSLAVKLFTKSPIRSAMYYGDYKYVLHDDPENSQLFAFRNDHDELRNLLKETIIQESVGKSGESPGPSAASGPGQAHPVDPAHRIDWAARIRAWFERYEELTVSDFKMTAEQMEALRSLGYIQD